VGEVAVAAGRLSFGSALPDVLLSRAIGELSVLRD
jgi:hypothetical protein